MSQTLRDIIALEAIKFQNDVFFKELTQWVEAFKKLPVQTAEKDTQAAARLQAIIGAHTNMLCNVQLMPATPINDPTLLGMVPPALDKNNPMVSELKRQLFIPDNYTREFKLAKGILNGKVDLNTGKVSGFFSKVPMLLTLPVSVTHGYYPAEEVAAGILHEVGHGFVYFEHMSRMASTNYALHAIARNMEMHVQPVQREYMLVQVKHFLGLRELDVKELMKSTDKTYVEMVVMTEIIKQCRSELGSSIYDSTNWEALADQYVARQGGAKALAFFLDRVLRRKRDISVRTLSGYLFMEGAKLLSAISIVGAPLSALLYTADGAAGRDHDKPGVRLDRIRNDLVEAIKIKNLPKEQAQRFLEDIKAIDEIRKEVKDRPQFFDVIARNLFSYERNRFSQERLQQELEKIASNDLFIKAAELRNLGK